MKAKISVWRVTLGVTVLAVLVVCAPLVMGEAPPVSVEPQKITLDVKGMDVIDVLKIISQRANINIAASKNVTGKVTIFLKDVDVWDAFEIVLLSSDLAYETRGNIISVMTGREYEAVYGERFKDKKELKLIRLNYAKALEVAKALNQVKTAIGRVVVDEGSNTLILMETPDRLALMEDMVKTIDVPVETRVFSLDYAKSDKLNPKIQDMVTKGIGSVRFDERTNKVVVTDVPQRLAEIEKVVDAFDEKTRQVLIDAKIVQVELNDKFRSGINWKAVLEQLKVEQTLTAGLTTGGKLTLGTFRLERLGQQSTFDAMIDFLREVGRTDIISSPRVTAIDGQEAKILVGTKEAYVTGTTTTPATGAVTTAESVSFVDVGVQLYVTPMINKGGFVTMKIRPVISSVTDRIKTTASPAGVPIIKTSEAETSIVVKDGVTIVMGGLMEDKKVRSSSRFPLLGDIPLVGLLFRNTSSEMKKTEVVIFLTPTIISGDSIESSAVSRYELSHSQYYEVVRERILNKAMGYGLQSDASGEVAVLFSLKSDGSLKGEPKLSTQARPALAELAVRSVKESAPFPSFPESFKEGTQDFKVTIMCE